MLKQILNHIQDGIYVPDLGSNGAYANHAAF